MAHPLRNDAPPTLIDLVRDALDAHDGVVDVAVHVVASRLLGDDALLRSIIGQTVIDATNYRTQAAVRSERATIIKRATDPRSNVIALANGLAASLLDMPLAGGIRLRSCDRTFVQQEADRFNGLAADCARKGRFLSLIAQSVPDGRTVGDVISNARALEIWEGCARGDL